MNNNKISTQELLKKIRQEVAVRKGVSSLSQTEARLIRKVRIKALAYIIIKIHDSIKHRPLYQLIYSAASRLKRRLFSESDSLNVNVFLQYHDIHFIKNAYNLILQRPPDEDGFKWWLSRLRTGQSSKTDILYSLRYSDEGQKKNIKIKGLYWRYNFNRAYKIPVAGYLLSVIAAFLKLPHIVRKIGLMDVSIHEIFSKLYDKADMSMIERMDSSIQGLSERMDSSIQGLSERMDSSIQGLSERMDSSIQGLSERVSNNKASIIDQQRRLSIFFDEAGRNLSDILTSRQIENISNEKDHILDDLYIRFEAKYRGAEADVRRKLSIYLPYIELLNPDKNAVSILDIGCGRGEWLKILKENGYQAKGIEINRIAIQDCIAAGLDVFEADALQYLRSCTSDSFNAITGFHIIEHLPFETLIAIFDEAFRVLAPGGVIIFETPNPTNLLVSLYDFYRDPTHIKPLHPDTINFVAEDRGFINTASYFISEQDNRLELIKSDEWRLDNIDDYIKAPRDFALIGYKG